MDDEAIQGVIKREFETVYENLGEKLFQLQFTIAGKTYTTTLKVKCKMLSGSFPAKLFTVKTKSFKINKGTCIDISIAIPPPESNLERYSELQLHKFSSMIEANNPERRCFDPILVSNRNNPELSLRVSSADVLQILKTKLQYLLPNPYKLPIYIQDAATTKYVPLTPFHILRGNSPFYTKYGYVYPNLIKIIHNLPAIHWETIRSEIYYGTVTYGARIEELTKKTYEEDAPIINIFQDIPFELESKANEEVILAQNPRSRSFLYNNLSLSLAVLNTIARQLGYTREQLYHEEKPYYLFFAYHDDNSPEWLASSKRLLFTSFTPVAEGGRRKTQRQKTRRQKTRRYRLKK